MNIIDEISRLRGCHSCIALTFNFDIAWFESLFYQKLLAAGIRRILIVTDTTELSSTIESQTGTFHRAGLDYSVIGIDGSGCFHPKAVFLIGNNTARLYIGSGNITSNGFGRNLEVYERFEANKNDAEIPIAFDQFRKYLNKIFLNHFGSIPNSIANVINYAFGADLLMRSQSTNSQPTILGSPNELLKQLDDIDQPADSLTMLAPYFDSNGNAVLRLVEKFKAKKFTVITDKRRTNLCTNAASAINSAGGIIKFLDKEIERPLHAKIVLARGQGWSMGISGSANLSNAAWYGHNAELVVLRRDDLTNDLEVMLNSLKSDVANEKELADLGEYRLGEDENDRLKPPLHIKIYSAKWISKNQIEIKLSDAVLLKDTKFEFLGSEGPLLAKQIDLDRETNSLIIIPSDSMKRGRLLSGRIIYKGAKGPYIVIEDSRKLAEHAQSIRRLDEYAKDLLLGDYENNPPEKLLKYLFSVYKKRTERFKKDLESAEGKKEVKSEENLDVNDWVEVSEDDFETKADFAKSELSYFQSTGGRLRLIELLLFGSETPLNADYSEGESELGEDEAETKLVPPEKTVKESSNRNQKLSNLADIVSKARELYLEDLNSGARDSYPLGRIVEDMQVLCAAIHSALEAGYISEIEYRIELQSILFALLGSRCPSGKHA